MSFLKALMAVGAGFAAARGMDQYRKMGGMAGLQDMLQGAGDSPTAEHLGALADKFGLPGGSAKVKELMGQMGTGTASVAGASAAGLGSLMTTLQGAATAGSKHSADMISSIFGGTPVNDVMERQAKLMIRAMIQAAKADGEIDPQEQAAILEQLSEVTEEERAFIQAELAKPIDIAGLAEDTSEAAREQVYAASLSAIRLDHAAEAEYLRQLAIALQLSDALRDRIHASLGVPPMS
ncbi:DUF533 domain-containing protein [Tropicimonas sp. IMCC6043]|uniref:DUF533 domain-containing protein n=1 Tax=Tropicimonas sp. IMCC6043 TaxID=2510645 RepID=UPI00101BE310|nr:DUF533 domain-containing protein [Tropicimonas sp. IMCC6043]RYH11826.1 tellurite resistance TerB family protein [Tropicimonas sp. IMCC6043]